ncbi:LXG domain-containing protein [Shouchella clausii]|uniref:LXG domain-containing protein n=1 Tax=Shouchella clausii TaxID=79880 RepID=UPI002701B96F|nr:LXG domain-containing protein [Shouchella clausii]MDO7268821.1 LXG domain-containing protein [Shouchella clausii]MDO7288964.1 LXG domain-containing protein [Shouchella clausii]
MNTLDVQEVLDALDEIVERKLHDQAQLERLQASIQKIIHLDSLQGEGGEAIKDHFATLHLPVLAAFQLFIGQYIEQLKQIRSNLLNFENSSALIREEVLADVKNGLDRVERYAITDATAIESIRASIADLLPLPPFSMEPVLRYAQQGKDHVRITAERLGNLDEANDTVLASAKSTLQELTTVVSQVANWTSGGVIASPETQAEIDANMEELYQNVVTQALQMAPLDRSHVEGREGELYQDVLPLEFLYTGAYAPLYGSLKAANWYYLNHFPVNAMISNEQALQACRAPSMGETHAVTPAYFPLFARLSTLPANATVSPAILTRQLKQLVPIQYQWYQAQLRTQAIQTDTSQVVTIPEYMFTDQEVAAINTYLENNPPSEERLNTNPIVAGVVDFLFGDYITLADPEASLGEKALATTFILVKPAKVGEVVYDLSKARKVKTGGKGAPNANKKFSEMSADEQLAIAKQYSRRAPIEVPENANMKAKSMAGGYEQITYKWNDGTYKYEVRWHTRTSGAPADQGNTWVIQRTIPGSGGNKPQSFFKIGENEWVEGYKWYDAIAARKAGTATPEQVRILDQGHWKE